MEASSSCRALFFPHQHHILLDPALSLILLTLYTLYEYSTITFFNTPIDYQLHHLIY
jgi:hypothetical protein